MTDIRPPAVAGSFYPETHAELRHLVDTILSEATGTSRAALAAIVPHAGLIYSGACAARVFKRIDVPPVVVILAPNHTGAFVESGAASLWSKGAFETPLGQIAIAESFAAALCEATPLVVHDEGAHAREHAIEVELPLLSVLAPGASLVPIILPWDEWPLCQQLAAAIGTVTDTWPDEVLLVASSDMTHFESASAAHAKDSMALERIKQLDGKGLLDVCGREHITMCGRAPVATVLEAARRKGAGVVDVVDYRHSGLVTGDDEYVVAYAGVVIR